MDDAPDVRCVGNARGTPFNSARARAGHTDRAIPEPQSFVIVRHVPARLWPDFEVGQQAGH